VKIFPASIGGPELISAVKGPMPQVALIPTGGIDGDNAAAYLAAGAVAVGVGGWLTGHSDMAVVSERAARLADSARFV
jgi:2-dehydro-3-deoxyphosphogluconate aldolase/(4S)-4-hydroxy-2-oxoglutarate aldolase